MGLTAHTINHELDLRSVPPYGTIDVRLNPAEDWTGHYRPSAVWRGLDLPHQLYGSYALAETPFGRAVVRLDSRPYGMTFEFIRVARETDVLGSTPYCY